MKQALKYCRTRKTILSSLFLIFLLLSPYFSVNAQDSIVRPKLGLALSGGGSHGLAGFGIDADIEILRDFYVNLNTGVFAIQEMDRDTGFSLLAGYGIGLGYMSVIGPVKAGLMHGLYNREIFYKPVKGYISVGFNF